MTQLLRALIWTVIFERVSAVIALNLVYPRSRHHQAHLIPSYCCRWRMTHHTASAPPRRKDGVPAKRSAVGVAPGVYVCDPIESRQTSNMRRRPSNTIIQGQAVSDQAPGAHVKGQD